MEGSQDLSGVVEVTASTSGHKRRQPLGNEVTAEVDLAALNLPVSGQTRHCHGGSRLHLLNLQAKQSCLAMLNLTL